jgi:hypothetical protein
MSQIRTPIGIEAMFAKASLVLITAACAAGLALQADASCGEHKDHRSSKRPAHVHEAKPMFGGVVAVVNDIDYELVATPEKIALHIYEHGVPMDSWGASARVKLLSNGDKITVTLKPTGIRFEAEGRYNIRPGARAVATVVQPGKASVTTMFKLR